MNILVINYEFPPIGAGASNAGYYLSKALLEQGHEVSIMTSAYNNFRGYSFEDGIHVYRIPAMRKAADRSNIVEMASFMLSGLMQVGKIIVERQIAAAIVFFSIPCGPIGLYISKRFGTPYIISLRGGDVPGLEPSIAWVHRLLLPLRHLILRLATSIVANSEGLADASKKVDPFPVEIIYNGVDTDFFKPKAIMSPGKIIKFLFVGRFQEQKNLFYLFEQFAELLSSCDEKVIQLHMVGDGPHKEELGRSAKKLGIEDKIVWYGWVNKNELRELYQNAHCLINPSLYEGMPNTVLEAMACGVPAIVSDVPGNDAVVVHGKTGYLFSLSQPDGLQQAMRRIIEQPDFFQKMGQSARQWVIQSFSWKEVASKYTLLLNHSGKSI